MELRLEESSQSALEIPPDGAVTFRVKVFAATERTQTFTWETSVGTLEVSTQGTVSEAVWVGPECLPSETLPTVRVTIADDVGNSIFESFQPLLGGLTCGTRGLVIAAGVGRHALVVTEQQKVQAWGNNESTQLGRGEPQYRTVSGLTGVTAVKSRLAHVAALKEDGSIWTWGSNAASQLGADISAGSRVTPMQVPGLTGATAIAVGDSHTVALLKDGSVWTWGDNRSGQLGDAGRESQNHIPAQVPGLASVVAIAAGGSRTVAVRQDGTVWTWGTKQSNRQDFNPTPVQVPGLTDVIAADASDNHVVVLRTDGTVWGWGRANLLGGSTQDWLTMPVQVPDLADCKALSAGDEHTVALRADGTVWVWGTDDFGQLGNGGVPSDAKPVQAQGLMAVKAVAAGNDWTVAIGEDGSVWAWGSNYYGQLGDGSRRSRSTPVRLAGLTEGKTVSVGSWHAVLLRQDGSLRTWGSGYSDVLGDGTTYSKDAAPVQAPELSGVKAVAAAYEHSVAVRGDGTVWSWGLNQDDQLGDGTFRPSSVPVQVLGITGATAVAAGGDTLLAFTVALREDGTVWSWGNNYFGMLGHPAWPSTTQGAVQVPGLMDVTAIAAGNLHAVALRKNGSVWSWGRNSAGQLGDGTNIQRDSPVPLRELANVKAITAGRDFAVALHDDGTVWAWGANDSGQLGDGTFATRPLPQQVQGLTGVVAVDAGDDHTLALRNDGTVWAWGNNDLGQLGDGTRTTQPTPVQMQGFRKVSAVAAGFISSVVLLENGTVWGWGAYGTSGVDLIPRPRQVRVSSH
ncbi:RCC1 domain-containing protein [Myxococcus hansupus]|uniref:RCC1 domain-containing protein n=1 Tax=Pseudomyxococcus hansupus TaxID=1297742 RepID=UPI0013148AE2|nr:RCC1 domain-containing protein [Myxococcus hansupus]